MSIFTDLCLVADTEADMIAALPFARDADENGNAMWQRSGNGWALDPIGPLCTTPAVIGADMIVVTPAVIDERFHANLRLYGLGLDLQAGIPAAVIVAPVNPRRVWA